MLGERVCAIQARCGTNKETCIGRWRPITRVLSIDVIEALVACIEKKAPAVCEPGEAGQKARQQVIGACVVEATEAKQDAAGANIDLFANAVCERTQQCGVVGVFSKPQCLGEGRAAIRSTGSLGIYGALRPSSVDDLVSCLKARKCDGRDRDAAKELEVCLDEILATAAEVK